MSDGRPRPTSSSVDRSATLRGRYGRFDLFPAVSLLTPGFPWLNITPTVGARETYYTSRTRRTASHLITEPLSRHYGTAGLARRPVVLAGLDEADGDKLKHLIEPRVEYTYVSNPGGDLSSAHPDLRREGLGAGDQPGAVDARATTSS